MLQCIKHTHAQAHMQTHSALFFVFWGGGGSVSTRWVCRHKKNTYMSNPAYEHMKRPLATPTYTHTAPVSDHNVLIKKR